MSDGMLVRATTLLNGYGSLITAYLGLVLGWGGIEGGTL